MFEKKYLIIIGVAICLLILYYFHDEISKVKKLFVPAYQKTMALEARVIQLERKALEPVQKKKCLNHRIESPALSITYQSDMVKNGNLSAKYTDLSETEARELIKKLEQDKNSKNELMVRKNSQSFENPLSQPHTGIVPAGMKMGHNQVSNKNKEDFPSEDGNIINIKITDLIKNPSNNPIKYIQNEKEMKPAIDGMNNMVIEKKESKNPRAPSPIIPSEKIHNNILVQDDDTEYEKILNGLTNNIGKICSENIFDDDELDTEIVKSITESIREADLPSEHTISDIPESDSKRFPKNSKSKSTKKNIQKKIN